MSNHDPEHPLQKRYYILPDDRGWPMAHEVRADGSTDPEHAGSMTEATTVSTPVTVDGNLWEDARVTATWFRVGTPTGGTVEVAGEWAIIPPVNRPAVGNGQRVQIMIAGHLANGVWCEPSRIAGVSPFPFTRDEWESKR